MKTKNKRRVTWLAFGLIVAVNCFGEATASEAEPGKPESTPANPAEPEKNDKVLARFGGVGAAKWEFETGNPDFRFPLRIESTGQGEAKDVTVVVRPLWGPDGKSFEVNCRIADKPCEDKINLASGQAIEGMVAVKLGSVGTYSAWITLTHAGRLESRLVEIKRVLRDPTFNVTGGEQASDGVLWVTIVDVAAEATKLSRPEVLNLTRDQEGKSATQAKFKSLEIRDESGKPVTEPIDLAATQPRRLTFTFVDLEPGEYAGKLQFAALNGSKPKEFEIKKLTARWDWGWALLPIFIGAVVSHFLREWATRYRPMLVKRQSIVALVANLDDAVQPLLPLDDAEARVEASVRNQLDVLDRTLDADAMSAIDTQLAALTRKVEVLPFWVLAGRRVGALEPPSFRIQFQDALLAGENFLSNPRSEATDPSIDALRKLDGTITAAVRVELRKQVKELHDQVEGQIQSARRTQHRNRLIETLRPQVAILEGAVESDDKSVRDLLEDARSKFARALIDDFRQSLDEPAPATVEQADWTSLKDRLVADLGQLAADASAQTVAETYRAALRTYVETLAALLVKGVGRRKLIVEASHIADADKTRFLADLQSIDSTLKTIQQEARDSAKVAKASGDLEAVTTRLSTLADDYLRVAKAPLGAAAGAGAAGEVNKGASVPEGLSDDARQQMPDRPAKVDSRSRARRFGDWIHTGDAAVTLAAGVIALVLGLKAVWADNPGWGGFDDSLIALLWGLGLHQGASGVFEGIAGLKRKFS